MNQPVRVGEYIWGPSDLPSIPIGSTLRQDDREDRLYEKVDLTAWKLPGHGSQGTDRNISGEGYLRIQSIPEVADAGPETWGQWLWRFRDHVLSCSHRSGITIPPVLAGFRALEPRLHEPPLYPGMRVNNMTDLARLPIGTLLASGVPEQWSTYGLHEYRGRHDWLHLLGHRYPGGRVTIVRLPDAMPTPEPWLDQEVGDPDEAMRLFRLRAWLIGMRGKQENSWCGTFEATMRQLGITHEALNTAVHNGRKVGDVLAPSFARDLPAGSILIAGDGETSEEWFIRDDESTNLARTRRLFGWGATTTANFRQVMRVGYLAVNQPDSTRVMPMHLPFNERMFEALPAGTMLAFTQDMRQDWHKSDNGRIGNGRYRPNNGSHRITDFNSIDNLRVKGLPA